jgi:UPF0755 protein
MKTLSNSPLTRVLAGIFVAFLFTGLVREVRGASSAPDFSCNAESSGEVNIEIFKGQTGSSIAAVLATNKVVKSAESFFREAVSDPRSSRISPGTHRVDMGLCASKALEQLLDPKRTVGLISIVEGMWVSEVIPQLIKAGFSSADVQGALKTVKKPDGFSQLEGLLFPAQYSFAKGTTTKSAIESMVNRAQQAMSDVGFFSSDQKFTPQQLLVIASLVQAEGKSQDFKKISQPPCILF